MIGAVHLLYNILRVGRGFRNLLYALYDRQVVFVVMLKIHMHHLICYRVYRVQTALHTHTSCSSVQFSQIVSKSVCTANKRGDIFGTTNKMQ